MGAVKISVYLRIQKSPVVKCILQIIGGKEKVEHMFGMHLIKETICRAERCAQCRRLPSNTTLVTTLPNQDQKQASVDLLLKYKEASSSAEYTCPVGKAAGLRSDCSQPRLSRNTCHKTEVSRIRRWLVGSGGRWQWWHPVAKSSCLRGKTRPELGCARRETELPTTQ